MGYVLSGIIAGDDKILKLNFPLLPKATVAALDHCANVKVGPMGAPCTKSGTAMLLLHR